MTLRSDLVLWKEFVEITQRRNLIAHTDGIVSSQYLKICKEQEVILSKDIKIGDPLSVDLTYFEESFKYIFEIVVKLTHTIWRKFLREDFENADTHLISITYELLLESDYELSNRILSFAYNQKEHFDEFHKNIFLINLALSKYLKGDKEDAISILNKKDWSAVDDEFKIAYYAIIENEDKVYELMEKISGNGKLITRTAYKTFPLFKELRKNNNFQKKFEKIFQEPFLIEESPLTSFEEAMILNQKKLKSIIEIINSEDVA